MRRKLEPGGRIAVNVANLGRKPYRSLSADVIRILQDDLGLLLRGELIWQKGEGATGSCAWGSFRSAANPVLRDITERVVIASKGRFDRARSVKQREADGLPHESTLMTEDFMALTLDVWDDPARERAPGRPSRRRSRSSCPSSSSGSTPSRTTWFSIRSWAAGRRSSRRAPRPAIRGLRPRQRLRRHRSPAPSPETIEGKTAQKLAEEIVAAAGFTITERNRRVPKTGTRVSIIATDADGAPWFFDVTRQVHPRTLAEVSSGTETVWKALGRAHALRGRIPHDTPVVFSRPSSRAHAAKATPRCAPPVPTRSSTPSRFA